MKRTLTTCALIFFTITLSLAPAMGRLVPTWTPIANNGGQYLTDAPGAFSVQLNFAAPNKIRQIQFAAPFTPTDPNSFGLLTITLSDNSISYAILSRAQFDALSYEGKQLNP